MQNDPGYAWQGQGQFSSPRGIEVGVKECILYVYVNALLPANFAYCLSSVIGDFKLPLIVVTV